MFARAGLRIWIVIGDLTGRREQTCTGHQRSHFWEQMKTNGLALVLRKSLDLNLNPIYLISRFSRFITLTMHIHVLRI